MSVAVTAHQSVAANSSDVVKACDQIVRIFNGLFKFSCNTVLVGGAAEPLYQPADENFPLHRIFFTLDYAASSLHEVAHWCVAGAARRLQLDYGYWYAPDGRTPAQQVEFERVEVAPQALEWMFAEAAGQRFRVSADNLELGLGPSEVFKDAIYQRVIDNCRQGVNSRAEAFIRALADFYGTGDALDAARYRREALN